MKERESSRERVHEGEPVESQLIIKNRKQRRMEVQGVTVRTI